MLPNEGHQSNAGGRGTSGGGPDRSGDAGSGDAYTDAAGNAGHGAQSGFFGWMRGLGIVRENGWLGGVCGGVAARLGIDPIIVRGVVVVIALLGGPAFLFYAAAWVLLPDAQDRIHLERIMRGIFDPPAIAIIVMAVLAFLPIAQGVWWAGGTFWYWGGLPGSIFKAIWSLVVIAAIVVFVVWAARGFPGSRWQRPGASWSAAGASSVAGESPVNDAGTSPPATGTTASASAAGETAGATRTATTVPGANADIRGGSTPVHGTASAATGTTTGGEAVSTANGLGESTDLTDWQRRQAEWRAERDAWRAQHAADQSAARAQRGADYRQASANAAAREEARRRDSLANPRASARFTWATIGLALVAGAVASWIASTDHSAHGYGLAIALAAATAVFGLASIVTALMRRRGGFLGFLGFVLLIVMLAAAFAPGLRMPDPWTHYLGLSSATTTIHTTVDSAVTTVQNTIKELR